MKKFLIIISIAALAGTLFPAGLLLSGTIDLLQTQQTMLFSTMAWFVSTPFWMRRRGA